MDLKLLEESIKLDANKFIKNIIQIKSLKFYSDENDFARAKKLWFESEKLLTKIRKLEYSEDKLLPLLKKRLINILEKAKEEVKELN